jgi:hypothetical protein
MSKSKEREIPADIQAELERFKLFLMALAAAFDPLDIEKNRGKFVDSTTGEVVDDAAPGEEVRIVAGLWEEARQYKKAMQHVCSKCGELVGLDPRSQQILRENAQSQVLCIPCGSLMAMAEISKERLQ